MESSSSSTRQRSCVVYARGPSNEQEGDGFSVDAQLRLLRRYAKNHSLAIERELVDKETAKRGRRSQFGGMVRLLGGRPTHERPILLVERPDRLYRTLNDFLALDELAPEIHFVKESSVLSKDSRSSEKLIHGIKILMATNYIQNLSAEKKKGMRRKAEQGIWPGSTPPGYRKVVGSNGKKTIEPDPETAFVVAQLFALYGTGQFSIAELTKRVHELGWRLHAIEPPVRNATVYQILRNRVYTGDFDWNGETFKGSFESIVSHELWERAQAILNRRPESAPESTNKCDEPHTRDDVLRERFAKLLCTVPLDNDFLSAVIRGLRESYAEHSRTHEEAIQRLHDEHTCLQACIESTYVDVLSGRLNRKSFDHKTHDWRTRQRRLLRTIAQHQNANATYMEQGMLLLGLAERANGQDRIRVR